MAGVCWLTAESRRSGLTPGAPVPFAANLPGITAVTADLPSGKAGQQQYG